MIGGNRGICGNYRESCREEQSSEIYVIIKVSLREFNFLFRFNPTNLVLYLFYTYVDNIFLFSSPFFINGKIDFFSTIYPLFESIDRKFPKISSFSLPFYKCKDNLPRSIHYSTLSFHKYKESNLISYLFYTYVDNVFPFFTITTSPI